SYSKVTSTVDFAAPASLASVPSRCHTGTMASCAPATSPASAPSVATGVATRTEPSVAGLGGANHTRYFATPAGTENTTCAPFTNTAPSAANSGDAMSAVMLFGPPPPWGGALPGST